MRPSMWDGVISSFVAWDNPAAPNDLVFPKERAAWVGVAQPTTGTLGKAWGANDIDTNRLVMGLAAVARLQLAQADLPVTIELVVDIPSDVEVTNRGLWTNSRSSTSYSGLHIDFLGSTGVLSTLLGDGTGTSISDRRSNAGTRDIRGIGPLHILCIFLDLTEVNIYINGVLDIISSQSGSGGSLGYQTSTVGAMMGLLRPFSFAPAVGNKMYAANFIHRFVGPQEARVRSDHFWEMFTPAQIDPTLFVVTAPPGGTPGLAPMIILNM